MLAYVSSRGELCRPWVKDKVIPRGCRQYVQLTKEAVKVFNATTYGTQYLLHFLVWALLRYQGQYPLFFLFFTLVVG